MIIENGDNNFKNKIRNRYKKSIMINMNEFPNESISIEIPK